MATDEVLTDNDFASSQQVSAPVEKQMDNALSDSDFSAPSNPTVNQPSPPMATTLLADKNLVVGHAMDMSHDQVNDAIQTQIYNRPKHDFHQDAPPVSPEIKDSIMPHLKYILGITPDVENIIPETAKSVALNSSRLLTGLAGLSKWIGEGVQHGEGKDITQEPKWVQSVGKVLAEKSQVVIDYLKKGEQSDYEKPNPDIFRGSFVSNPSWSRAASTVAGAFPILGAASLATIATGGNPAAGLAVLGLTSGGESYEASREAGKTVGEASLQGGLSAAINTAVMGLPMNRVFKGFGVKPGIESTIRGAAEFGGINVGMTAMNNIIAKVGGDKARRLMEGTFESFLSGAMTGGVVGAFTPGHAAQLDGVIQDMHKSGVSAKDIDAVRSQMAKEMVENPDVVNNALKSGKVYTDIKSQLLGIEKPISMTTEQWHQNIEAGAQLWSARVASEAQKRGETVDQTYARMRPTIQGEETANLLSKEPVGAKFIGYQDMGGDEKPVPLFNVTGDHQLKNSTVSDETLKREKIPIPDIPTPEEFKASPEKFLDVKYPALFQRHPEAPVLEDQALKTFGEAKDLSQAGFILPSGKMVDFTRGGESKLYRHQDISQIYPGGENDPIGKLQDFMKKTGAVRLSDYSDIGGKHLAIESQGPLSSDQIRNIGDYLEQGNLSTVTFENTDAIGRNLRSKSYDNPTGEDVARFFNGSSTYFQSNVDPTFFSQVQRTVDEKMPAKASGDQIMGLLKNSPGIKQEELDWIGLPEFLKEKKSVTKAEVQKFIADNNVQVQEVTRGEGKRDIPYLESKDQQGRKTWVSNVGSKDVIITEIAPEIYYARFGDYRVTNSAKSFEEAKALVADQLPGGDTKFSKYTLPGGENYRELLLTLPENKFDPIPLAKEMAKANGKNWESITPEEQKRYLGYASNQKSGEAQNFTSSHFPEPNILAHVRFNDRLSFDSPSSLVKAEGQKSGSNSLAAHSQFLSDIVKSTAFSKEGLSGLNVEDRKTVVSSVVSAVGNGKIGEDVVSLIPIDMMDKLVGAKLTPQEFLHNKAMFTDTLSGNLDANIKVGLDTVSRFIRSATDLIAEKVSGSPELARQTIQGGVAPSTMSQHEGKRTLFIEEIQSDLHQKGREKGYGIESGVPDFPFKKTWHELVLKRMLRYATENGFDKVAWTSGDQQAERYDLSKQVDEVRAAKATDNGLFNITAFKDGESVLKEIDVTSDKLSGLIGKDLADKIVSQEAGKQKSYSGIDLKVGGEGMKGFYDKIIPDFLNKYTKKWGGKVGETDISGLADVDIAGEPTSDETQKVHSLDITPSMKESVMQGQPLFQSAENGPRGSTSFTPKETIIRIFKNADSSTMLHESAHVWLKDIHDFVSSGKADAKYLEDWKKMGDWLGVKEDAKKLTTDQHEKFARAIEAYAREGIAPVPQLQNAFDKFKDWLSKVYRSAQDLKVEIPDQVKGVLDRMFVEDKNNIPFEGKYVKDEPLAIQLFGNDKLTSKDVREEISGIKNEQIVRGNQLADKIRGKIEFNKDIDRAIIFYGEAKGDIEKIANALDDPRFKDEHKYLVLALDLSEKAKEAWAMERQYYDEMGRFSKQIGTINDVLDNYQNRIYAPEKADDFVKSETKSGFKQTTRHSKQRIYDTIFDAIENGKKLQPDLGSSDLLAIHNEEMARVNIARKAADALQDAGIAVWSTDRPEGWQKVGDLQKSIPITDKEGNNHIVTYNFYAPEGIAKGLKAITERNFVKQIDSLRGIQRYQGLVKTADLSYSLFHHFSMLMQIVYNGGLKGLAQLPVMNKVLESPEFLEGELLFVRRTGITAKVEATQDIMRHLVQNEDDTFSKIVNLPGVKQTLEGAQTNSEFLFGKFQRYLKVMDFMQKNAEWITDHPNATNEEVKAAQIGFAKHVNAVYGGLNWEAMGMTKSNLSLLRLALLAPDWTVSNIQLLTQALSDFGKTMQIEGKTPPKQLEYKGVQKQIGEPQMQEKILSSGTAGSSSRSHIMRALVTAMVITEGVNKLITGHFTDENPSGHKLEIMIAPGVYISMLRGGIGDISKYVSMVKESGLSAGSMRFAQGKLGPAFRTAIGLASNTQYTGAPIYKRGEGHNLSNDYAILKYLLTSIGPVPLGLSNFTQYLKSGKATVPGSAAVLTGIGRYSKSGHSTSKLKI